MQKARAAWIVNGLAPGAGTVISFPAAIDMRLIGLEVTIGMSPGDLTATGDILLFFDATLSRGAPPTFVPSSSVPTPADVQLQADPSFGFVESYNPNAVSQDIPTVLTGNILGSAYIAGILPSNSDGTAAATNEVLNFSVDSEVRSGDYLVFHLETGLGSAVPLNVYLAISAKYDLLP
jgi:hypothetical protein